GVENVDVSSIVSGHLRYRHLVGSVLKQIGWEDIDLKQVAQDEETLDLLGEEEKKEEGRKKGDSTNVGKKAAHLEQQVKQKNDQRKLRSRIRKMKIEN
ncbi:MAG: TMCO4 family protein, partial [Thaumarchaeota archaeon]|nr:TMCO4 family protein [Nitrososphaerota archaeon]